ncbi:MAG: glycoside hydrolase [Bacteroidetes bacterium]|nr:glycoside hydrolase [Bacteroidota bacterium]
MKAIIFFALTASLLFGMDAKNEKLIIDLRGNWKFEIGDNTKYAEQDFDDKKWSDVFVPSDWENEGFAGYDGYAWYRKSFTLPASAQPKIIVLRLGFVDDVCRVYVNGNPIGEGGNFPPVYQSAYNQEQQFRIPSHYLKFGQLNIIAVRVFDEHLNGGIVKGKVGIFEQENDMDFVTTFPELWKFKTGDSELWKDPFYDDSKWQELLVPAKWDFQGYREFDGFAWYRVTFDFPASAGKTDLVLMLGRIDDIDEAYLNGEKIGSTGRIRSNGTVSRIREEYRETRAYDIPASTLKPGKKNVLAVRVYDNMLIGGIYEGPIGIVTAKEFRRWERWNRNNDWEVTPVDKFFDRIFTK